MEEYYHWAKTALSIDFKEDLKIIELGDGERGVYFQRIIPSNSTILTIPFECLLTIHSAKQTPLESVISSWREDDILALLLLYEKHVLGDQSRWSLHLKYLPVVYHNTINFMDEELEWIKGSNLYLTTIQWKQQIQSDYLLIHEPARALFQNGAASSASPCEEWLNFENYLWALCTIWSRFVSVRRGDTLYRSMVPFFDMLNHSPSSPVGHIFLPQIDSLALVTSQSLTNCQQELTLNYGELSNTKLMMLYGFCLVDNPFDSVDLYLSPMPSELSEYRFKKDLLALWKIDETQPFRIKRTANQGTCGLPRELILSLRVQYGDWGSFDEDDEDDEEEEEEVPELSAEEQELIKKHLGAIATSEKLLKKRERKYQLLCRVRHGPVSLGNEMIISQLLLQSVESMIQGYATTLEEDQRLLEELQILKTEASGSGSRSSFVELSPSPLILFPSERQKNSILLRYTEKFTLATALHWITAHMTNLLP
jgi:hypothetical protein